MIGRLTGKIADREPGLVILEVGGVGYELQISLQTFAALPEAGEVTLFVHTHMRDSGIQLFGFLARHERVMFERLQTVAGVGPKLALAVLSGRRPEELAALIRARNTAGLTAVPGIGKRTAERMITDLRDKVDDLAGGAAGAAGSEAAVAGDGAVSLRDDARLALMNLGYGEAAVDKALDRLLGKAATPPRLAVLLRDALRALSKA